MMRVKVDAVGALRFLGEQLPKQQRFAAAVALTRTAKLAQDEVIRTMRSAFDRPTPWTLRGTRVIPATKARLTAEVWLKDRRGGPASKENAALFVQTFGGKRGRKASETALLRKGVLRSNEFLVPAKDAPLDAFGNVPTGMIRQILSQLQAAEIYGPRSGYTANVKKGAAQSAQSKRRQARAGTFFVPRPGTGLPRGIYRRKRTATGWQTEMIFKIVVGKPNYRSRLPLQRIGQAVADRHFSAQFDTALRQALATAR